MRFPRKFAQFEAVRGFGASKPTSITKFGLIGCCTVKEKYFSFFLSMYHVVVAMVLRHGGVLWGWMALCIAHFLCIGN